MEGVAKTRLRGLAASRALELGLPEGIRRNCEIQGLIESLPADEGQRRHADEVATRVEQASARPAGRNGRRGLHVPSSVFFPQGENAAVVLRIRACQTCHALGVFLLQDDLASALEHLTIGDELTVADTRRARAKTLLTRPFPTSTGNVTLANLPRFALAEEETA